MNEIDRKILNKIQFDFPLDSHPYLRIGEAVGTTESDVIGRIGRLRQQQIIRQIGAIFDTRNLGYASSLVAMRVPPERIVTSAARVSDFPGVSHNYRREDRFNLWFTVAVPPPRDLNETVKILSSEAGSEATLILPALRIFKIGVKLDMTGESNGLDQEEVEEFKEVRRPLSGEEIEMVRVLQGDLEMVSRPFGALAEKIGMTEERLLRIMQSFLKEGIMRRYAAVLHHRKAGFAFNGMGIWKVPDGRIEDLGLKMGAFRGVSHCYQRPASPEWPYSLYTMVHGATKGDCEKIIAGISEATGVTEYKILYSTEEYKKRRIEYFSPAFDEWYEAHPCPFPSTSTSRSAK